MIQFNFDNVTLYNGDSLAILSNLPSDSIDAVLTDPPYSSGGASLSAKQADPASKYQQSGTRRQYPPMLGDAKDQRSWTHWCMLWLAECWRISRDGAPLMVFTDWRQLPALTDALQGAGWRWLGIVPWDKPLPDHKWGDFVSSVSSLSMVPRGAWRRHHVLACRGYIHTRSLQPKRYI